jgi:hypothetical protein
MIIKQLKRHLLFIIKMIPKHHFMSDRKKTGNTVKKKKSNALHKTRDME